MDKKLDRNGADADIMSTRYICNTLGCTRMSFWHWRTKYDDFPKPEVDDPGGEGLQFSMKKVRAWLDRHPDIGNPAHRVGARREALMCDNIAKRNELLERQIAEADKHLVNGDKVREIFVRERTLALEVFRRRLLSEIPAEAEGKRAPKIASLLTEAFDEFLDDIQKSIPRIVYGE